ncbi:MAG: arginase family protein [Crocinitomicaceae bacterium]
MKSKYGNFLFRQGSDYLKTIPYSSRHGEVRVGDSLKSTINAPFQIIGIQESIGPIANNGFSGAENAIDSFLSQFQLTQVHEDFDINSISFAGVITIEKQKLELNSELIEELDDFVYEVLTVTIQPGHTPIIIGGGHNNALPLMRWAKKNKTDLAVVNIDPHADTREPNGRHSGNSFSYAINENTLTHYHVLGLHEAYNNTYIRKFLKEKVKFYSYFEDYLFKKRNIIDDIASISFALKEMSCGIELDMDSLANFPSSAISPSGWTLNELRQISHELLSKIPNISYLHLPEAAPKNQEEYRMCGKALSYLVRDFIRYNKMIS